MIANTPHYFLFSETAPSRTSDGQIAMRWRFVLEEVDGSERIVAEDLEPGTGPNRLELLAVVRGLEALDQSARVTLVTRSRYVSRGFRRGLAEWRRHGWRWERFGRRVSIRDCDLWQRVDRALEFHQVDCRVWGLARATDAEPLESSHSTASAELVEH